MDTLHVSLSPVVSDDAATEQEVEKQLLGAAQEAKTELGVTEEDVKAYMKKLDLNKGDVQVVLDNVQSEVENLDIDEIENELGVDQNDVEEIMSEPGITKEDLEAYIDKLQAELE